MLRKLGIALTALALWVPAQAAALGVGDYELHSHLNEPLRMTVELHGAEDISERQLLVNLASDSDYERSGVRREAIHGALDFEVKLEDDGTGVLYITSDRAVREPYLNFLIELLWPTGRTLREYTVLLDPPTYEEEERPVVTAPEEPEPEPAPEVAEPEPEPEPAVEPEPEVAPVRPTVTPEPEVAERVPPEERREHRIASGETMWEVALEHRPSRNISVQQMLMAIREMNPDAFIDDNVNLVREGAVLRMPSEEEVRRIKTRRALADMADHNRRWRERLEARGIQVPTRPEVADHPAEEPEVADVEDPEGRVTLVGPDAEDPDAPRAVGDEVDAQELEDLRGRLASREEDLDALERENRELTERVEELEEQMDTSGRLLEARSTRIAQLQEELRRLRDDEGIEIADEALLDEEIVDDEELLAVREEEPELEPEDEEDDEVAAPAAPEEAPDAPTPPPEPAPVPEQPGIADMAMENLPLIAGALAAVALLAGGLLMYRRRQEAGDDEEAAALAELSELDSGGDDDFFGGDLLGDEDAGEGDAALAGGPEGEGADEKDPLEEADFYAAYGRHEQAAEVLREAIGKDPERHDLKTRLLDLLAETGNSEAFEQEAERLSGAAPEVDNRISELRKQLGVAGGETAGDEELSLDDLEMDLTADLDSSSGAGASEDPAAAAPAAEQEPEDFSMDFSLDEGGSEDTAQAGGEEDETLEDLGDFELDLGETGGDDEDSSLSLEGGEDLEAGSGDEGFELSLDDSDESAESGELDDALSLDGGEEDSEPSLELEDTGELSLDDSEEAGAGLGELSLDEGMSDEFSSAAETASEEEPDLSLDELDLGDDGEDDGLSLESASLEDEGEAAAGDTGGDLDEGELSLEGLDAEIDELSSTTEEAPAAEEAAPAPEPEAPAPEPAASSEAPAETAFAEDDDFDFLGDTDENATKLDLARAYIDMGDNDGARDILNEVIAEGNNDQQQEARNLLGQVG